MPSGKLPKRYNAVIVPLLLSLVMTCVVSAISVIKTQGISITALGTWPATWGLSWLIAFPVLLVAAPLVRRLSGLMVEA